MSAQSAGAEPKSSTRETLTLVKRVTVSQQHRAYGISLTRARNGDFIVVGSDTNSGGTPWAVRVDGSGQIKRWEYFDDPSLVGKDSTLVGNRFSDGFELDDGTTFLCGTRFREGHQLGTTVQISAARAVTSQNLKSLGAHDTAITKCLRWNQGIVLLAGVAGDKNTGWLVMLDSPGKLRYVRFGEEFRAVDAYEAENHDLIILSSDNRVSRVR